MTQQIVRTYSELSKLKTFEERFRYLKLGGAIGEDTFGFERYLNQTFYKSKEWRRVRDQVIFRDCGCDLGVPGHEIYRRVIIHHMNPILSSDILDRTEFLLNPEYLITTTHETHNAIHYGDESILQSQVVVDRFANDTCPWRK